MQSPTNFQVPNKNLLSTFQPNLGASTKRLLYISNAKAHLTLILIGLASSGFGDGMTAAEFISPPAGLTALIRK